MQSTSAIVYILEIVKAVDSDNNASVSNKALELK